MLRAGAVATALRTRSIEDGRCVHHGCLCRIIMDGAELEPSKRKRNATYDSIILAVLIQSSIEALRSAASRLYGEPQVPCQGSKQTQWLACFGDDVGHKYPLAHDPGSQQLSHLTCVQPDKGWTLWCQAQIVLLLLLPAILRRAAL